MKHENMIEMLTKHGLTATPDPESETGYHTVDAGEWIGSWHVQPDQSIYGLFVRKKPIWSGGRPAENKDLMASEFPSIESFVGYIVSRRESETVEFKSSRAQADHIVSRLARSQERG